MGKAFLSKNKDLKIESKLKLYAAYIRDNPKTNRKFKSTRLSFSHDNSILPGAFLFYPSKPSW